MQGIYVVHFPEMKKNIYKIGCSGDINARIKSFNNNTIRLCTKEVTVLITKECIDYRKAEAIIHKKLKQYRIVPNKEFFKCSLKIIQEVVDALPELDTLDSQDLNESKVEEPKEIEQQTRVVRIKKKVKKQALQKGSQKESSMKVLDSFVEPSAIKPIDFTDNALINKVVHGNSIERKLARDLLSIYY